MRCQACNYSLWNLRSRQCPECGRPFVPSEFEFVRNSVRFCCPHCDQDYYGTGPRGHLVPAAFDCVKCGQRIGLDEMVLRPTEGLEEEDTVVDRLPWAERRRRGTVRAWAATVWRAMVEPGRMARSIPPDSRVLDAWWFAVLSHVVFLTVGFGPFMLVFLIGGPGVAAALGFAAGMILFVLVSYAVYIPLWGAVAHAVLRLTGRVEHPLGWSVRVVCYASGAHAPIMVPCLGPYVGWLWAPVSATVGLAAAQRVGWFRAILAAVGPPVVLTLAFLALWMLPFVAVTTTGTMAGAAAVAATAAQTQQVVDGLFRHADANGGRGPAHALELVHANELSGHALALDGNPASIKAYGTRMDLFLTMPPEQEDAVVRAAVEAQPADVVAHRVGDYVFTYHGMDLTSADPELWVAIAWPDPEGSGVPPGFVEVGLADRRTRTFPLSGFPAALEAQNALRGSLGLPALPDPGSVTSKGPAVGGGG